MLMVLFLLMIQCLSSEGKLFGDHVCQTEITEPREVLQWELQNRTVRTYKWCMNVPPRCSIYSNKVVNETKVSVINETKSIETCCEGFYEQNSYCISLCQQCKNGLCLKGICICQSGWEGPNCDSRNTNSQEENTSSTKITTSSTANLKSLIKTQTPTGHLSDETTNNIVSTTLKFRMEDDYDHYTSLEYSTTLPTIFSSINKYLEKNISTYSTNSHSPFGTVALNSSENMSSLFSEEETPNSVNIEMVNISSPKNEETNFLEYTTVTEGHKHKNSKQTLPVTYSTSTKWYELKKSGEQFTSTYSTKDILFDTIATKPAINNSTIPMKTTEINSEANHKNITITKSDLSSSNDIEFTATVTEILRKEVVGYPDSEEDYRELGGQSLEENSTESKPQVMQTGTLDKVIYLNILENTSKGNNFRKHYIEESSTQNIPIWETASVIEKPNIVKDESQNTISKEDFKDSLGDSTEERYQKRSSIQSNSPNTLLTTNEPDSNNLIYSVCAASATTVIILIVVITVFSVRNSRKKMEKNKGKKDVATVAVYTTSIFHSPLPEPPTFENPTYLSTGGNENWKETNEEMIEVQDFNVVFLKPLKNPKLDCKQYLHDHPPSTGSYRASSDVDTLSQYNLSRKSLSGIIVEPLYDEIPCRDNPIESKNGHDVLNGNNLDDASRSSRNYVDNNSLYVNTFGRTVF